MKRIDRLVFFLGLFLIISGFSLSKITELTSPKQKITHSITHSPTVVIFKFLSPTATASAVLGEKVLGEMAVVDRVVDGDTIEVNLNSKKEKVRLIGVDTPETVDPRKTVQCFGKEASSFTKNSLENKTVMLESDPTQGDRDKYQRLLRYIFLEDGTNFNKMLIQQGYAHEYTYRYPYKYQAAFKLAQKDAMENNWGLWGSCK